MKTKNTELLAPAGTPEAAWAALAYGADAVYAGMSRFSARAEAGNFTPESLDELIGYAHSLGRRIYITANTLVQQNELDAALETLATLRDLNADGVIVQDMGLVRLIQKNVPSLRLHGSTQMAVHNLEGARQLASLGFKRVVLARELDLKTIEHISRNCGIEVETFVHGALCYSYSGLCLFSSHTTGRSGNRGRCAYNCRQSFECAGNQTLPFSMKDFYAAKHVPELLAAGVSSLKMEGRMKSPLYVAAVTDFYRKMLDGNLDNPEALLADLQTIFGRPATDLYLDGADQSPVDPVNDGHRGALIGTVKAEAGGWLFLESNRALQKHDGLKVARSDAVSAYGFAADEMRLASDPCGKRRFELPANADIALKMPANAPPLETGAAVYCSYSQAVRQRYDFSAPRPGQFRQRRPVRIRVVQTSEKMTLTASANHVQAERVLSGPFDAPRQPEKAAAAIRKCFEKLGDTDWQLDELTISGPAVFVPMSVLNDARRQLIEQFSDEWNHSVAPRPALESVGFVSRLKTPIWSVKSRSLLPQEGVDEFVLEVSPSRTEKIEKALAAFPEKLRLALPVIIRDDEVTVYRRLIERFSTHSKWEASNIGGLHLLQDKSDVTADWSLYTLNTQAALQWRAQGVQQVVLSPEDDAENMAALLEQLGSAAVVPVFQHTPLMISATRPAADGCRMSDRSQREFHVEESGREFVFVNDAPFSLSDRLDELKAYGAQRFRIDLSYGIDSTEDVQALVQCILSGLRVSGHCGNFVRGLK